jgi:hypothetical protein
MNERNGFSVAGIPFIGLCLVLAAIGVALVLHAAQGLPAIAGVILLAIDGFMLKGFFQVAPNEGQVLQLFGKYAGTVRIEGLRWSNPFYSRRRISLRVRNFESGKLKVNDSDGNPIEIGGVAGTGYRRGRVLRRRLRELRAHPERVGAAADGAELSLRCA